MQNSLSQVHSLIDLAIQEDIGSGDHSTRACINQHQKGEANLVAKQAGIIAGIDIANLIFNKIDSSLQVEHKQQDGALVSPGDVIFNVKGRIHSILLAERLVLNTMQRMSGIATETNFYVNALAGYPTKVLDTRKTAPGVRVLDKMAVSIGGGVNHRFGLFDMIMLKDNHIDYAGGIESAIYRTQTYLLKHQLNLQVVIEARSIKEVEEILAIGHIDRIMLDNFSIEDTNKAVQLINHQVETESSGMINLDTIKSYAACGVDYISVGSLTHKVNSLDLSLKASRRT